jgi:hypothetical protein
MARLYYVGTCPQCDNQGRLCPQKDMTRQMIYAHCEECECGFRKPEDVMQPHRAFLTLLEEYETVNPTEDEISQSSWAPHVVKHADV